MKAASPLGVLLFAVSMTASAQHNHHETVDTVGIISLTAEEIQAYREGFGMGMAKPAELNGYPGPKHVLEREEELQLTPVQIQQIENLRESMLVAAREIGKEVLRGERQLNALFESRVVDEAKLKEVLARIEQAKTNVRFTHLSAHLKARRLLTDKQLKIYYEKK